MQLGQSLIKRMRHWCARLCNAPLLPAFAGGTLIGLLTVSTALTWLLTWGHQREFVSAACLMFGVGLLVSRMTSFGRDLHWSLLAVMACCWGLLQPVCLQGLTSLLNSVPVVQLESVVTRWFLALAFATPIWVIAAVCGERVVGTATSRSRVCGGSPTVTSSAVLLGIGCGLALNSFLLSPVCGAWWASAIGLIVAVLCWWWSFRSGNLPKNDIAINDIAICKMGIPACPVSVLKSRRAGMPILQIGLLSRGLAALMLGGLFAVASRLVGQLMPDSFQVGCAEWIGLIGGFAVSLLIAGRRMRVAFAPQWLWLFAAAWSAMLLATFPVLVDAALWMNASLTWVAPLLAVRSAILIVAVIPLGIALGSLSSRDSMGDLSFHGLPFLCGLVLLSIACELTSSVWLMTLCCASLVALTAVEQVRCRDALPSWRAAIGMTSLALMSLSVPLWQSNDNPARVSKLLFSTPAFLAHRSGWGSKLLPMLDDTRMVFHTEGPHGLLTLWRSRGLELHLRENGIPRAVISVNTDVHPQFAPEVLLAVLPLIISDRPGRVLVLGTSSGVPLSTCLHFPVREAVCVEGDARLIALLRGPLARETGFDPLSDDRAQLISAPPELALMAHDEPFDVILSSPPPSSVTSGGASFTTEYYRRASRHLADRGIFCQRFECLDYGPGPLRLVVQSLRQAFRDVIAVETAAGELLLMATNTNGVFIPDDLPARLEAPHVRRLLARSGLDWSMPLNFPAYDHAALGEICDESHTQSNSAANGLLALNAPLDVMRWGTKLLDTQNVLTAIRTTPAPFWNRDGGNKSNLLAKEAQLSRKSRFLEWLGESRVSAELLRRLSEVATQQKLVREFPESHWWEYRKALRQQLKDHPRSAIQQVRHIRGEKQTHPEDLTRKSYFEALGEAAQRAKPTAEQIAAIEACLEPYDPLLSYFGQQEIADLQARSDVDASGELAHRLHVIYFAPAGEASTRNVASTLELLVRHPEAIADDSRRFDVLNGLVQLLRTRWESRQQTPVLSVRRQLTDVDRSVIAVEKALTAMDGLAQSANLSTDDWAGRKQVVDRILLRPLRAYRGELQASAKQSEGRTRAIIEQAADTKAK